MLLDTNVIIHATQAGNERLKSLIAEHAPAVSAVSYVEAFGYHRMAEDERVDLEEFFLATTILALGGDVLDRAVALRQQRRIKLGDALIAATALVHGLTLVTRNTRDFAWIDGLVLLDPLA